MAASSRRPHELYDETAAKNPKFKKIYDQWRKFRDDSLWFAVAEKPPSTTSWPPGTAACAKK